MGERVEIVEMGPRDGFQGIGPFIPTAVKFAHIEAAAAAGLRRIEIGSFVSAAAVPQLRDTPELLARCAALPGVAAQVLVPSERRGRDAAAAGARHLAFVLSASEAHNRSNVRRHPLESVEEYGRLLAGLPDGTAMRLNVATAFDCPFTGRVPDADVLALLDRLVPLRPDAEVCLCDTTGRADPAHVDRLFAAATAVGLGLDQRSQRGAGDVVERAALHVADALAGALDDAVRVGKQRAIGELDVHVGGVRDQPDREAAHAATVVIPASVSST